MTQECTFRMGEVEGAFSVLTGHNGPLSWQRRFLEKWLLPGVMPQALDLPTGLGKTSVMALWLIALASQMQEGGVPRLPRRLVYVVDRRAVVDQATAEAEALAEVLSTRAELSWMRESLGLGTQGAAQDTLPVSTLRGKLADNRAWLADPSKPAIIVGTVDMIGSRLLFSGYGVSRGMRPVHAAMLAVDTLFVLDESHLVPPFQKLLEQIAGADERIWPDRKLVRPLQVLPLSATGETKDNAFTLDEADLEDAIVAKRLRATKRLELHSVKTEGKKDSLVQPLVDAAWGLAFRKSAEEGAETDADASAPSPPQPCMVVRPEGERAARVIVYAHSREVAQKVAAELEKRAVPGKGSKKEDSRIAHVELFTGARRVFEREKAAQRLQELGFLAGQNGNATLAKLPAFLVATAAAEVGVDLDADHMVGDLVPLERMIQRFGRVNRLGELGDSRIVVVVDEEALEKEKDADERARMQSAVQALEALQGDASPAAIANLKQTQPALVEKASTPMPLYPPLEPAHVEAWAMTSLKEHTGRPDIQPWLRGWVEEEAQAVIIWRAHLPWRDGTMQPVKAEVEEFFRVARPHLLEMLEAPASLIADVLVKRAKGWLKALQKEKTEKFSPENVPALLVLSPASDLKEHWSLADLANVGMKQLAGRIAGQMLVAVRDLGGLDANGLLSKDAAQPPATLDDGWDEAWIESVGFRVRLQECGSLEAGLDADARPADAGMATAGEKWRHAHELVLAHDDDGEVKHALVVEVLRAQKNQQEGNPAIAGIDYPLRPHLEDVANEAEALAQRLGLPPEWCALLCQAGWWHDMGKNRVLWQQAANSTAMHNLPARQRLQGRLPVEQALAKTRGPFHGQLLGGYRHEFGSLLDALEDEELRRFSEDQRDIILHLVAAHHGRARPLIDAVDPLHLPSHLKQEAAQVALRFARLQKRFGPWGLAWLEALLRAADRMASAAIEQQAVRRQALARRDGTDG